MASYIALLRKDKKSDYGVEFPDLPGCITAGSTLEEARAMAEEALAAHVALLREDGDPVPEPSSLDDVTRLPELKGAVPFLVELKEVADRAVRINITVPERALTLIDRAAEGMGMNRSAYLARAAESIAQGDLVASEAEFTQWAREHLAKGRQVRRYVIATWPPGAMITQTVVKEKLATYVKPREREDAGGLRVGRRSLVEHIGKAGAKAPTPLNPNPRRRAT